MFKQHFNIDSKLLLMVPFVCVNALSLDHAQRFCLLASTVHARSRRIVGSRSVTKPYYRLVDKLMKIKIEDINLNHTEM